uniref:Uncharacterized protein n=2 Tax=Micrurus spixii TaxID=129469 RepID=A0A2D4N1B1_9SAUR
MGRNTGALMMLSSLGNETSARKQAQRAPRGPYVSLFFTKEPLCPVTLNCILPLHKMADTKWRHFVPPEQTCSRRKWLDREDDDCLGKWGRKQGGHWKASPEELVARKEKMLQAGAGEIRQQREGATCVRHAQACPVRILLHPKPNSQST